MDWLAVDHWVLDWVLFVIDGRQKSYRSSCGGYCRNQRPIWTALAVAIDCACEMRLDGWIGLLIYFTADIPPERRIAQIFPHEPAVEDLTALYIKAPCGVEYIWRRVADVPKSDWLCVCGDPKHYIVKYQEVYPSASY